MMNTLWQIVKPWAYMAVSVYYLIVTIIQLAAAGDVRTLQSWEAFNDTWFGNLWSFIGPRSRAEGEKWVAPLLEGRIKAGRVSYSGGGRPIDGVVLEIGAGSGMWTQVIADVTKAAKSSSEKSAPAKIYGVEPNPISAAALKRRVKQVGLAGVYEVLPFGIEDLQKETSIKAGSVDCIMTVQCLCSIPEPEKNIRLLYEYLKPGGRWYVYEHVKAEQGLLLPLLQRLTNIIWPFLMGSCQLCRPTLSSIVKSGQWESVDYAARSDESAFALIPHVVGTLTKAA